MNRWRSRLVELQAGNVDAPTAVQIVQSVQNRFRSPTFEQIEHFEQHARARQPKASATDAELVAPSAWFERVAPPASGEPRYEMPCAARRGRVEEREGVFLHFCAQCGAWGAFGYGVSLRSGRLGRWYCAEHRPRQPRAGDA
jgi:hypothetical protein